MSSAVPRSIATWRPRPSSCRGQLARASVHRPRDRALGAGGMVLRQRDGGQGGRGAAGGGGARVGGIRSIGSTCPLTRWRGWPVPRPVLAVCAENDRHGAARRSGKGAHRSRAWTIRWRSSATRITTCTAGTGGGRDRGRLLRPHSARALRNAVPSVGVERAKHIALLRRGS